MTLIVTILLILALASFVIEAIGVESRVNLIALGLALWVLSVLIPRFN